MNEVNENTLPTLEVELREFALGATGDPVLADALVSLNGWAGGEARSIHRVSKEPGLSTELVLNAMSSLRAFCNGKPTPVLSEVLGTMSKWQLPCAAPTVGHWLAKEGLVRSDNFLLLGIMNAAELFGIELQFRVVSKDHTKWLVDPAIDNEFHFEWVEKIAKLAIPLANRFGIINPEQFESLHRYSSSPDHQELFWETMEACPELAADDQKYVICKQPRLDAEVVKRLDRLLSFAGAVPFPIALKQITRDGGKRVLPDAEIGALTAFVTHCAYYEIEDDDVVSARPLIVDEELSSLERPVILSLLATPGSATLEELDLATRTDALSPANVRLALHTSPLIVTLSEDRYALLEPSMYDDLLSDISTIEATKIATEWSPEDGVSYSSELVDLAAIGSTGEHWWAMYAGPIPLEQLQGAQRDSQAHMVILDPETKKCVGLVRTSRVFNKYFSGIPSVFISDKGLTGTELPRFIGIAELRTAISNSPYVYYNEFPFVGQESWGIVHRSDVTWV